MSAWSSFVEVDISILSKHYNVIINTYKWQQKWMVPLLLIHQFFILVKHSATSKLFLVSSGGYWSIVPVIVGKLFSTPVFIILNGSDCASLPLVNYGNLRKPMLRNICRLSFKYADLLLPVSESLVETENTYYAKNHTDHQGYRHFFPFINTRHTIVYNGLNGDFWECSNPTEKEKNSFISVFSSSQYILKGGDLIVDVARRFPECNFYMAGITRPQDGTEASPNVHFLGRLTADGLKEVYRKCQFHFQLSIFEGFGCTLCEAMLCQCIPIGSAVNFIPQIIGNAGFILKHRDVDLLESLIREALGREDKSECAEKSRARILENFSIENREKILISLIEQQTASNSHA